MDEFIVMPNHLHGILLLSDGMDRAATRAAPTVGGGVGAFKSLSTVEYIRGVRSAGWPEFPDTLWQRNYYEQIIRTESSLDEIRRYIADNPPQWPNDENNPARANGQQP
jgi:REP element-mobilizing transposase RayT